ncbi:MAG: hypothetical protein WC471_03360 [Candidatus Woesearchaeota archaeon]
MNKRGMTPLEMLIVVLFIMLIAVLLINYRIQKLAAEEKAASEAKEKSYTLIMDQYCQDAKERSLVYHLLDNCNGIPLRIENNGSQYSFSAEEYISSKVQVEIRTPQKTLIRMIQHYSNRDEGRVAMQRQGKLIYVVYDVKGRLLYIGEATDEVSKMYVDSVRMAHEEYVEKWRAEEKRKRTEANNIIEQFLNNSVENTQPTTAKP